MRNRFIAKLAAVTTAAVIGIAGLEATEGAWSLATDVQKYYRCLPYDWYVVRRVQKAFDPRVGDLVQFTAPAYVERFTSQFEIIKYVGAVAGDHWEVRDDTLYVNDREWAGLPLMSALNKPPGSLDRSGTVPVDHVLVLGTNPSSYDSRYWGPLHLKHINGRAYAIL